MTNSLKLKPVAVNFTLKDHIHGVLLEAIMNMNIYDPKTNLRLDERKMAEQLGISRTPIREALVRLEQDGFVDIQARKGVYVLRKSLGEILDMIVVWAALESMAAHLVTEKATDEELAALRELAAKYSANSARAGIAEYSDANFSFHQRILELSKCAMIGELAGGLFLHMYAVRRRAMEESDRAAHSVADHMEIINALESRDAELASKLVRQHTMRLHDHIREMWPELINFDGTDPSTD